MELLESMLTVTPPESDILKIAYKIHQQIQVFVVDKYPPEVRQEWGHCSEDYALKGIHWLREVAEKIEAADIPPVPEQVDWQILESSEEPLPQLSPDEVAVFEKFLTQCKREPHRVSGVLVGPILRIVREFATLMLGLHFAIVRRDGSEAIVFTQALSKVFRAVADVVSDHLLIIGRNSRNQRRQVSQKARNAKTDKHGEFRKKVFDLYLKGKEKGKWRNPNQAKNPLTTLVFEEARKKNILTSFCRAESTIYGWLCADRKKWGE